MAIALTSAILGFGFASFLFAYMRNSFEFGLLSAAGIVAALASDILLGPALVAVGFRK